MQAITSFTGKKVTIRQESTKRQKSRTIPWGSSRQSQTDVGRGHECIFWHIHGPHKVVDVDKRVKLRHLLRGDNFTWDPHYTATEHKENVISVAGELMET